MSDESGGPNICRTLATIREFSDSEQCCVISAIRSTSCESFSRQRFDSIFPFNGIFFEEGTAILCFVLAAVGGKVSAATACNAAPTPGFSEEVSTSLVASFAFAHSRYFLLIVSRPGSPCAPNRHSVSANAYTCSNGLRVRVEVPQSITVAAICALIGVTCRLSIRQKT